MINSKKKIVRIIDEEIEKNYRTVKKVKINKNFSTDFSNLFKMFEMKTRYDVFKEKFLETPVKIEVLKSFNHEFGYKALAYIMSKKGEVEVSYKDLLSFMSLYDVEEIKRSEDPKVKGYLKLVEKIGV